MCSDEVVIILTNEREKIERWKQQFDLHLNGAESADNEDQDNKGALYISSARFQHLKILLKLLKKFFQEVFQEFIHDFSKNTLCRNL